MRRYLVSDPLKCTGCRICEIVCSEIKKKVYNPKKSLIRVVQLSSGPFIAMSCRLCEKPPCVATCPEEALGTDETGRIIVDKDRCTGCTWCFNACEFGSIILDPVEKVVRICDLCEGDPECVKVCPEEALELSTVEAIAQKFRGKATVEFVKEILGGGCR